MIKESKANRTRQVQFRMDPYKVKRLLAAIGKTVFHQILYEHPHQNRQVSRYICRFYFLFLLPHICIYRIRCMLCPVDISLPPAYNFCVFHFLSAFRQITAFLLI